MFILYSCITFICKNTLFNLVFKEYIFVSISPRRLFIFALLTAYNILLTTNMLRLIILNKGFLLKLIMQVRAVASTNFFWFPFRSIPDVLTYLRCDQKWRFAMNILTDFIKFGRGWNFKSITLIFVWHFRLFVWHTFVLHQYTQISNFTCLPSTTSSTPTTVFYLL